MHPTIQMYMHGRQIVPNSGTLPKSEAFLTVDNLVFLDLQSFLAQSGINIEYALKTHRKDGHLSSDLVHPTNGKVLFSKTKRIAEGK